MFRIICESLGWNDYGLSFLDITIFIPLSFIFIFIYFLLAW